MRESVPCLGALSLIPRAPSTYYAARMSTCRSLRSHGRERVRIEEARIRERSYPTGGRRRGRGRRGGRSARVFRSAGAPRTRRPAAGTAPGHRRAAPHHGRAARAGLEHRLHEHDAPPDVYRDSRRSADRRAAAAGVVAPLAHRAEARALYWRGPGFGGRCASGVVKPPLRAYAARVYAAHARDRAGGRAAGTTVCAGPWRKVLLGAMAVCAVFYCLVKVEGVDGNMAPC